MAKPSDLHLSVLSDTEDRTDGKMQQFDPTSGDVLAHLSRTNRHALQRKLVMELSVDEVDLAKIRLTRIATHSTSVLHTHTQMRISVHSETSEEPDRFPRGLLECVPRATAYLFNYSQRNTLVPSVRAPHNGDAAHLPVGATRFSSESFYIWHRGRANESSLAEQAKCRGELCVWMPYAIHMALDDL